jgi:hypothetical protein
MTKDEAKAFQVFLFVMVELLFVRWLNVSNKQDVGLGKDRAKVLRALMADRAAFKSSPGITSTVQSAFGITDNIKSMDDELAAISALARVGSSMIPIPLFLGQIIAALESVERNPTYASDGAYDVQRIEHELLTPIRYAQRVHRATIGASADLERAFEQFEQFDATQSDFSTLTKYYHCASALSDVLLALNQKRRPDAFQIDRCLSEWPISI